MATNKLALLRYRIIDECLRNRFRKWTLNDLIEKVADGLYEYEGIDTGISKRTIQLDIQAMRSDSLGYNAPIIVVDRKYYTYEDANYSIKNSPINDADTEKLKEVVAILKHLNGFSQVDEMSEVIAKLDNSLLTRSTKAPNYIQMEGNSLLKGIKFISPLYNAIKNKQTLLIEYKSFKSKEATKNIYYPYLLKEYRNRWFVVVRSSTHKHLLTLALDRIINVYALANEPYKEYEGVDFDRYYNDTLGVTKTEQDRAQKVILWVNAYNVPYVKTKPLHHSQQVLEEDEAGMKIRIDVVLNFELEREILGFGETLKVIAPKILQKRIMKRVMKMNEQYISTNEKEEI
ncbi:helix-turn-helix transcriptional regulator [Myroides profundi]|uniref:Predicted DNA-binding transcriptional regulator YafY, contains an HTH and WYL domains n=1 Tax=Myroides profundi TaxID=480520 RepID=A0AAJ5BF21_MYRPR|nr:WYL domain-containing protein [Myroides profundi]AJH16190.1 transcriptional regulator [Myroides profundi]SER37832.1 Predicted DNA-binding transcriptional regulator YafY, contains an HTH and WYL domains [Myroides profundi]